MKHLAFSAAAVLGLCAISTPASAVEFKWNVEYTGWWESEGGGSVAGFFTADAADAADGVVSASEIQSWLWSWAGNDIVPAFEIQGSRGGIQTFPEIAPAGFFVDGTLNLPFLVDNLDQATYVGGEAGEQIIDLEFLIVQGNDPFPTGDSVASSGSENAEAGQIVIGEPTQVPEPATALGLIALVGASAVTLKRRSQEA